MAAYILEKKQLKSRIQKVKQMQNIKEWLENFAAMSMRILS